MATQVFIDTLFVVALISRRDQYHSQAVKVAAKFDRQPLLVTDAVLIEIGNALARNHKVEATGIINYFYFLTSDEIEVAHLTPDLFHKALVLYEAYKDKAWGLTDCVSFVVMKEAGATSALTFDRHFEQAGFRC